MKKYKLSIYNEVVEIDSEEESKEVILFAMRSGKIHRMQKDVYENAKNEKFDLIPTKILSELIRDNAIVRIDEDETLATLKENDLMVLETVGSAANALGVKPKAAVMSACFTPCFLRAGMRCRLCGLP